MSSQKIADSRVLRNYLTSLSPFPFKACSERIIDFHFLSANRAKFSGKKFWPPFYFAGLDASRWGLGTGKTANFQTEFSACPGSCASSNWPRIYKSSQILKYAKRRGLSQGYWGERSISIRRYTTLIPFLIFLHDPTLNRSKQPDKQYKKGQLSTKLSQLHSIS